MFITSSLANELATYEDGVPEGVEILTPETWQGNDTPSPEAQ